MPQPEGWCCQYHVLVVRDRVKVSTLNICIFNSVTFNSGTLNISTLNNGTLHSGTLHSGTLRSILYESPATVTVCPVAGFTVPNGIASTALANISGSARRSSAMSFWRVIEVRKDKSQLMQSLSLFRR